MSELTQAQINKQVCDAVADAMAMEHDEVHLNDNLFHDLGAESLDFLDIVFKLERSFGIQITR